MNDLNPRRLLEALLRKDLGAFTERAFGEVSAGQTFHHNWHLDALSYHLKAVADGSIKRLLITVPPRSLKSLAASIAFPAWLLGHESDRRIVCVSYASDLAIAHANSFRALVNAHWYKNLFPAMRIDPRKDTETELRTTRQGYRLTTTIGGSLTGRGGSLIIIDDPMKAADAQSSVARRKTIDWFDQTLLSRLDNKTTDAIIIVMQRLHMEDLAGHVLKAGGWTHLDLPAISERSSRIQIGPSRFYDRNVDDVLHPARESRIVLDQLKRQMGSAAFSAQYLQQPVPLGGNLIKWAWFGVTPPPSIEQDPRVYRRANRKPRPRIVQSWDTASKATELADFSVGITARIDGSEVHLLDIQRDRLDYPDLKQKILRERDRWKADTVLIEDKGSGTSLIQDLKTNRLYAIPILPDGDKVVRMSACSAKIEEGSVFVPKHAPWLDDFRTEILAFPHGAHDDQVDAFSQLLNWIRTKYAYILDYRNVG